MSDAITYWLATPRASGAVTFRCHLDDHKETLVPADTAPYFRKAFGGMYRLQAWRHWRSKNYQFEQQ